METLKHKSLSAEGLFGKSERECTHSDAMRDFSIVLPQISTGKMVKKMWYVHTEFIQPGILTQSRTLQQYGWKI